MMNFRLFSSFVGDMFGGFRNINLAVSENCCVCGQKLVLCPSTAEIVFQTFDDLPFKSNTLCSHIVCIREET